MVHPHLVKHRSWIVAAVQGCNALLRLMFELNIKQAQMPAILIRMQFVDQLLSTMCAAYHLPILLAPLTLIPILCNCAVGLFLWLRVPHGTCAEVCRRMSSSDKQVLTLVEYVCIDVCQGMRCVAHSSTTCTGCLIMCMMWGTCSRTQPLGFKVVPVLPLQHVLAHVFRPYLSVPLFFLFILY